jgi:glucose/arabinose dehydrogenase
MKYLRLNFLLALTSVFFLTISCGDSSDSNNVFEPPQATGAQAETSDRNEFEPIQTSFKEEHLEQLTLQPGFSINVFADDLNNPKTLVTAENGDTYVAEGAAGNIILLRDTNNDGQADYRETVASGIKEQEAAIYGLTIGNGQLYMSTNKEVFRATIQEDGTLAEIQQLASDLPDTGETPNRAMAFGPDERLYLAIESTCNACPEVNNESASILRFSPDASSREVYAKGLRNTFALDWHPITGQLWGMDHATDWQGNDLPPDELNAIDEGFNYGWPVCYAKQEIDQNYFEQAPEGISSSEYCEQTEPSVLEAEAHSAPMMMTFYDGSQFPEEFTNDGFVTMRGLSNRFPVNGHKIVRVIFDEEGKPEKFEDFVSGWLIENGSAQFGRPMGLTMTSDGSLLMSDDDNGIVYRISYDEENIEVDEEDEGNVLIVQ